jgi:hypothetical protein
LPFRPVQVRVWVQEPQVVQSKSACGDPSAPRWRPLKLSSLHFFLTVLFPAFSSTVRPLFSSHWWLDVLSELTTESPLPVQEVKESTVLEGDELFCRLATHPDVIITESRSIQRIGQSEPVEEALVGDDLFRVLATLPGAEITETRVRFLFSFRVAFHPCPFSFCYLIGVHGVLVTTWSACATHSSHSVVFDSASFVPILGCLYHTFFLFYWWLG